MLTTIKITQFIIRNVESIEIDEPVEHIQGELSERRITIRTYEGERYEINLEADAPEKLEFLKPSKDDWLTPKVYQGKSVHEEELEGK